MCPNLLSRVSSALKDPVVSLLPYVPYEESRDELPGYVENGVLIGMRMLVLDGFRDVSLVPISSLANEGNHVA